MRWVGGAAPSRGGSWRSDEGVSLLVRLASVAGSLQKTTVAGTPPAQYFPPSRDPLPNSLFMFYSFENNETNWVGAQAEIGPIWKYGIGPGRSGPCRRSPHSGQQATVQCEDIGLRAESARSWVPLP